MICLAVLCVRAFRSATGSTVHADAPTGRIVTNNSARRCTLWFTDCGNELSGDGATTRVPPPIWSTAPANHALRDPENITHGGRLTPGFSGRSPTRCDVQFMV